MADPRTRLALTATVLVALLAPVARLDAQTAAQLQIMQSGRRTMTAERVREAVALLPAAQRQALELAYFEGHTYRQVADVLGIPEGTAKSRLRLGLQRIAELLHPELSEQWA